MKNAAIRIHGLALLMGADRARVVGHDIGLMVAYAYAANRTVLGEQMKIVAADSTMIVLKDPGHWVLEEQATQTTGALLKFL